MTDDALTFADLQKLTGYRSAPWNESGVAPVKWFDGNIRRMLISPSSLIEYARPYPEESSEVDSGIYFLLNGYEIVYVGISACINDRLAQHQASGKPFDFVWSYDAVPEIFLADIEALYIHWIQPPLNIKYPMLRRSCKETLHSITRGDVGTIWNISG